jgi:hypothetical protein
MDDGMSPRKPMFFSETKLLRVTWKLTGVPTTFPALGTDQVDSHSQGLDDVLRVTDHLFRFISSQNVH